MRHERRSTSSSRSSRATDQCRRGLALARPGARRSDAGTGTTAPPFRATGAALCGPGAGVGERGRDSRTEGRLHCEAIRSAGTAGTRARAKTRRDDQWGRGSSAFRVFRPTGIGGSWGPVSRSSWSSCSTGRERVASSRRIVFSCPSAGDESREGRPMKIAAIYARVSSDRQKEDQTIASQTA